MSNNKSKNLFKIFVTDFDGTLTDSTNQVPLFVIEKLVALGKHNITRIVATGRSLFSLQTIIDDKFPIDYLVFSGGIGVMNWQTKEIIDEKHFTENQTSEIYKFLKLRNFDFMMQFKFPDNHIFYYSSSGIFNSDFYSRINYYEHFGVKPSSQPPEIASQFVIICNKGENYFNEIKQQFPEYKVTRATSPIDNKTNWIEIFPAGVSKANGIELIRKRLNVEITEIIAVGNDYYDIDMLEYVERRNAFVVSNAPEELKQKYNVIESNNQKGVAKLINQLVEMP